MTTHSGDLYVTGNIIMNDLTTTGGDVRIGNRVTLTAPLLTTISGNLHLFDGAILNAPLLTTIGGRLILYEGSTANTPKLVTVVGIPFMYPGATLNAISLTMLGGEMHMYPGANLKAPLISAYGQPGREIARCPDRGYVLWLGKNRRYYAGCRQQGFTRKQALEHWSDDTPRAKLFRAAILNQK